MLSKSVKIVDSSLTDAPLIGDVVVSAIGEEHARGFDPDGNLDRVRELFGTLAGRVDSQYSCINTVKAVDENDNVMGFAVGYDGAVLQRLRRAFISEVKRLMGRDLEGQIPDETGPGEFYLDSLGVFPDYRGRGVGRALIEAMAARAAAAGKPLGLLCEKSNRRARRLYDSLGFRKVGETPFAGVLMDHLQRPLSASI